MNEFDWSLFHFETVKEDDSKNQNDASNSGIYCNFKVSNELVGFEFARTDASNPALILGEWSPHLMLIVTAENRDTYFMRTDCSSERFDDTKLPSTVRLVQTGDTVQLPLNPTGKKPAKFEAIQFVPRKLISERLASRPGPLPEVTDNPLAKHSLLGEAGKFERSAVSASYLLGTTCLSGQMTMWFAPPNAGKTVILLSELDHAIELGRINPANVFYVNADDSSEGFAEKMRLMDDRGVHTLAPGHKGLTPTGLITQIALMAEDDKARGVLIILDTVKKFVTLMDKTRAAAFATICRRFVMAGGTIVCLAHTNKNPGSDGKLRYAGTSDLVDDCDAAYVITPSKLDDGTGDCLAEFQAIKRRGNNAEQVVYAFSGDGGISYAERLASVRVVDPKRLDAFRQEDADRADADLIEKVKVCITEGITAKMVLAKAVAKRAQISERRAVQLLERYTGSDPAVHRWTYTVQARGAKVFTLLPPPPKSDVPPDA